jgi:dihydropteroate synthase
VTLTGAPALAPCAVQGNARWHIRGATLSLGRPLVMGILNLTPDSFSDGGALADADAALRRAEQLVREGADLLDVGGESTRPGAPAVEPEVQLARVLPIVERLVRALPVPVSVDTRSAVVARAALEAGAAIVNDVSALGDPAMGAVVREHGAGVVLMHMRGTPQTMRSLATYDDVVEEVRAELAAALARAAAAGIPPERIVLDPGIGFAKQAEHSLALLAALDRLAQSGFPLLVGPSRKSFIGDLLGGVPSERRVFGTIGACVSALLRGARIFRVHDVEPVRQALDVAEAIRQSRPSDR